MGRSAQGKMGGELIGGVENGRKGVQHWGRVEGGSIDIYLERVVVSDNIYIYISMRVGKKAWPLI